MLSARDKVVVRETSTVPLNEVATLTVSFLMRGLVIPPDDSYSGAYPCVVGSSQPRIATTPTRYSFLTSPAFELDMAILSPAFVANGKDDTMIPEMLGVMIITMSLDSLPTNIY